MAWNLSTTLADCRIKSHRMYSSPGSPGKDTPPSFPGTELCAAQLCGVFKDAKAGYWCSLRLCSPYVSQEVWLWSLLGFSELFLPPFIFYWCISCFVFKMKSNLVQAGLRLTPWSWLSLMFWSSASTFQMLGHTQFHCCWRAEIHKLSGLKVYFNHPHKPELPWQRSAACPGTSSGEAAYFISGSSQVSRAFTMPKLLTFLVEWAQSRASRTWLSKAPAQPQLPVRLQAQCPEARDAGPCPTLVQICPAKASLHYNSQGTKVLLSLFFTGWLPN